MAIRSSLFAVRKITKAEQRRRMAEWRMANGEWRMANGEDIMTLVEQVGRDITVAMKARDAARLSALRMLKAALTNKEVEKGRALDEAEALQVVAMLVKQRRDSVEQFTAAGRDELAAREEAEILVLETYQPAAATAAEIEAAVATAVADTGATSPKDMGKVMKAVMTALHGKSVDGRKINEAVRARLAG